MTNLIQFEGSNHPSKPHSGTRLPKPIVLPIHPHTIVLPAFPTRIGLPEHQRQIVLPQHFSTTGLPLPTPYMDCPKALWYLSKEGAITHVHRRSKFVGPEFLYIVSITMISVCDLRYHFPSSHGIIASLCFD